MDKAIPQTTAAQARFLGEHTEKFMPMRQRHGIKEGFRPTYLVDRGGKTYDFVGRCRDAGLITIEGTDHTNWPYHWRGTWLTEKGWTALHMTAPEGYEHG